MKKLVIITMLYTIGTTSAHAQEPAGIQFIKGLNWQQVLDKAKTERKYIFVDCYATWCGPCKWMEKNVYPQKAAGEAMNKQFICVRMQMDHAAQDNDTVTSNYATAIQLARGYDIHAYPTLLFLNPDGKAVHKVVGALNVDGFVKASQNAMDPKIQYYTLQRAYQAGQLYYPSMRMLASEAKGMDDKLSMAVAADYIHNYIDKLSPQEMLTKENVAWLRTFKASVTSNDAFFKLCLDDPAKADTLIHDKYFAQGWIERIASQEVLKPLTEESKQTGNEPDWNKAKREIDRQFGKDYSTDPIIEAKIDWYKYKKDGANYARYIFLVANNSAKLWQSPPIGVAAWGFNNSAMIVFQYDPNKADLEGALSWMERINAAQDKPNSSMLDTQADLLYKLGRKDEAIEVETKAAILNPDDKDIAATLRKMKAGWATWPDKMN